MKCRFVYGMSDQHQMVVWDGEGPNLIDGVTVEGSMSVTISASCRKHSIILTFSKPNCVYLYDCVFNNRFKSCFWSGRVACIICE